MNLLVCNECGRLSRVTYNGISCQLCGDFDVATCDDYILDAARLLVHKGYALMHAHGLRFEDGEPQSIITLLSPNFFNPIPDDFFVIQYGHGRFTDIVTIYDTTLTRDELDSVVSSTCRHLQYWAMSLPSKYDDEEEAQNKFDVRNDLIH